MSTRTYRVAGKVTAYVSADVTITEEQVRKWCILDPDEPVDDELWALYAAEEADIEDAEATITQITSYEHNWTAVRQ